MSPRSESSAKKNEYKYIISAHGGIITSTEGTKYMAIKIPTNVEIFTYSNLGEILSSSCKKNYFICDNLDKVKLNAFMLETPIHKYSYKSDSQNIFPEVFLSPDTNITLAFYSGIVHCIPEHIRTTKTKAMEVIYNMDALVKQDCDKTTIGRAHPLFGPKIEDYTKLNEYNTEKQYSTYYKKQLKDYKYDPKSKDTKDNVSNKCGPLLLSQAIKVIQAHWKATYPKDLETSTIQIYLSCCLSEKDIDKHYLSRDYFLRTNETEYKELLAELDIKNKKKKRNDEQMENYYNATKDYYSLDAKSIIDDSLYTTDLKDFDSSKNLEEEEDGFSYSYMYLAKQIILIVSKLDAVKYTNETFQHYRNMLYSALDSLVTRFNELSLDFNEFPNKTPIDLRDKTPSETIIYEELLKVAKDRELNSKLKYTITLGAKKYTIEVHLEHDNYEYLKNGNYSSTESIISKQVDRVSNHKINKQSIFTIANTYTIKLKVSDVIIENDQLYEKMIAQVEATAEEAAALRQRTLLQSVREETAREASREAKAREASREASREAKAREAKAREASREAEAREAKAREAEAREASREAKAREASREAKEREAKAREAKAREASREAKEREASREAKKNKTTRKHSILGPTRTRVRVAPEPDDIKPDDIKPIKSKNRLRTVIQGLGALFSRKSSKVAPEPYNLYEASGIKTKFKRKRRRRISRNRFFSKIKTHIIPVTYRKKTFKNPTLIKKKKEKYYEKQK